MILSRGTHVGLAHARPNKHRGGRCLTSVGLAPINQTRMYSFGKSKFSVKLNILLFTTCVFGGSFSSFILDHIDSHDSMQQVLHVLGGYFLSNSFVNCQKIHYHRYITNYNKPIIFIVINFKLVLLGMN